METASPAYAARFNGPVGSWLLSTQEGEVRALLGGRLRNAGLVLEVGGAHGQLTRLLLDQDQRITVHASRSASFQRQRDLRDRHPGRLDLVTANLWRLPWSDRAFDLVLGVRLLAHVEDWQGLLDEMARVAGRYLLIDYAPLSSANLLTPALFWAKRLVERNTRPYFCYRTGTLRSHLRTRGFDTVSLRRQFTLPMGLHRALRSPRLSRGVEGVLRRIGLTRWVGSPALLLAERRPTAVP